MGQILSRRKSTLFRLLPALASVAALWCVCACNSSGCTENHSAIPLAEFYSSQTKKAITLSTISINGVDMDKVTNLVDSGTSVSEVYLPMRPLYNTTSWNIAYHLGRANGGTIYDTLSFDYDRIEWFAADECGAMYRYKITNMTHTHHIIDSVQIVDSLITNIDQVYYKIFFRTAEEGATK
jgi:hypothetical protein